MEDYYHYYNSPNNPKCRNCGESIKFSPNRRGQNGKLIPLNPVTDEPHRCSNSITSQENTVKSTLDSNIQKANNENQKKYSKKVRFNLYQQDIIAELSSFDPAEYNEIIEKLDNLTNNVANLTNSIEEIKQNQDRNIEKIPSSLDDDADGNQDMTENSNA